MKEKNAKYGKDFLLIVIGQIVSLFGNAYVIGEIPVFISVSGKSGLLGSNPIGLISISGLILCAIIMLIKLPTAKMVKGV